MKKLFIGRASIIGDCVAATVLLPYFKKLYPDSYLYWPIARKVSQAAPLFIGSKYIDKIHILEEWESLGKNDINLVNSCDVAVNPFPQHDGIPGINNFWWNERSMVQETVKMSGVDLNHFNSILTDEEKKPRLEKWFNIDKYEKTIALWPFAGYNKESRRSPSFEWYGNIII